ncbi:MAG TPA: molybdopterin-binding protein [Candidatus Limnocylindrales bacterium]|nr:molybdopterin-binding protein [Candidatus Limnocylindrales bacterium]
MPRRLLTAEILSVGSELTVGETRDTNAAELAAALTAAGVRVNRITALPDEFGTVREAFTAGVARSDLVISTGGLGPTPDDLTREAIAAAVGETPAVDPGLERWLRDLWKRRGVPFPELNLKQAWLIPSAIALPNPNGTAPGWWVDVPGDRVVLALPGPPREMRPMWHDEAMPRLRRHGIGEPVVIRTLRLTGIGESQVADLLGETLLRAPNPVVATYARADAVDVRISATAPTADGGTADPRADGLRAASALADAAEERVLQAVGRHVWARGSIGWSDAIGAALETAGWSMAVAEHGTGGSLAALLGDVAWLRIAERRADPLARTADVERAAASIRERGGADVGVAMSARPRGRDTAVSVVVVMPAASHRERRVAFLGGNLGRQRAALAAADVILTTLRGGNRSLEAVGALPSDGR